MAGTVTAYAGFDPEADCKKLRSAMKGLGTDEKAIIAVICYRSNDQRQELKLKYKSMYGKDLVEEIKGELSGDFEKVILGLMMPLADFDAYSIKLAVKGLGTDEKALVEVLCSRSNEEMQAMKASYKKLYKKDMEKAVASDVSGDFKRILVSLICGHREPDGPVDQARAAADAQDLYKAGEKQWGTDESAFNAILATRSYAHLKAVFDEYEKISKKKIEGALVSEMSGDLLDAYLALVGCVRSRHDYFAGQLHRAMKGIGTDEDTLTRVMVSRCEIDMEQIKRAFKDKYGKTLYSFIKDDTSGDYEKSLLALCRD